MPTSRQLHARNPFRNFFIELLSINYCMKTNSPNVLFNHRAMLLLEKTSQVMKQKLLLILMLVSICSSVFAQGRRSDQNGAIVVTDVNSILFPSGTSARVASTTTSTIDYVRVRQLITQVQSSSYYFEGVVKTYGAVPTNLYSDLGSLSQINNSISLKENIEIVTIRINSASELNSTIDLAAFSNFPNLKYIYFITKLDTTSENIASHIVNYDNRFNIFYKIDKGDKNQ